MSERPDQPLIWVDTTTIGTIDGELASFSVTFNPPLVWPHVDPGAARFPSRYLPGGVSCPEQYDTFTLDGSDHDRGNPLCGACFGCPTPCVQVIDGLRCRGLIHAEFLDEHVDSYSLLRRCDICGEAP